MIVRPGRIVQIAYAVDDVHAAVERFRRDHDAGPFVISEHIALQPDRPGDLLDHSSAYGQWGTLQVELVHVHDARPAALADSVVTTGGVRFAFHDTRADLGHLVEIYESHPRLLAFYDHVATLSGASNG